MRYARIGARGDEVPAALIDGALFDLRSLTADINGAFLEADPGARVHTALERGLLRRIEDHPVRFGAPIARPGAVVCVGMNYAAHAAESGSEPPQSPVIFLKAPNTVSGPNDPVPIPRNSTRTDWEVELGVVIGRRASYLDSPSDAAGVIAGYTTVNDVSERTFQLEESGGQWSKGKCAPGFTPVGPWLVTPDEVDVSDLELLSAVNGSPRQQSRTRDMIFDVNFIVWHLSQYMALEPGDLVLTGTPEGVALSGRFPYLKAGDTVEIEVAGLGRQEHRFVEWDRA